MAAIDHDLNTRLLRTHLLDYLVATPYAGLSTESPYSQWHFWGQSFDPDGFLEPSTLWIKEVYDITDQRLVGNDMVQADGFYQLQVNYPYGENIQTVQNLVDHLSLIFQPAQSITDTSPALQHVKIINAQPLTGAGDNEESPLWWQQILRVQWSLYKSTL